MRSGRGASRTSIETRSAVITGRLRPATANRSSDGEFPPPMPSPPPLPPPVSSSAVPRADSTAAKSSAVPLAARPRSCEAGETGAGPLGELGAGGSMAEGTGDIDPVAVRFRRGLRSDACIHV
eukprot:scaffold17044_cov59-Phaeocystis_antarctica.AAC.2